MLQDTSTAPKWQAHNECVFSFGSDSTDTTDTGTLIASLKSSFPIQVYPNPASNLLNIISSIQIKNLEVRIMDLTGRQILSLNKPDNESGHIQLDITNLSSGIYFILFKHNEDFISQKFIKK